MTFFLIPLVLASWSCFATEPPFTYFHEGVTRYELEQKGLFKSGGVFTSTDVEGVGLFYSEEPTGFTKKDLVRIGMLFSEEPTAEVKSVVFTSPYPLKATWEARLEACYGKPRGSEDDLRWSIAPQIRESIWLYSFKKEFIRLNLSWLKPGGFHYGNHTAEGVLLLRALFIDETFRGFLVKEKPSGKWAEIGLEKGDIVEKLNGKPVGPNDADKVLFVEAGSVLTIKRDEKRLTLRLR